MQSEHWNAELYRLLYVLLCGLVVGYLIGYWLAGLLLSSVVYIGWMLHKLRGLQQWLEHGQPIECMPDSDGAWGQVVYMIHRKKQKYGASKQNQQELVRRFHKVMAVLPDAIVLLNNECEIQWANSASLTLLGIDNKKDAGYRIDNLVRIPKLSKILREGNEAEAHFQSPREEGVSLEARVLQVQPGLWLLNVRNISQRVKLNNMRRAFIANASHELRTPLTVLTGYLELFEDDPELPAHLLPALTQSREQAERMRQIIDEMLTLSRLENSEVQRSVEVEVDLPALIKNTIAVLQKTMAMDSHQLSSDIDAGLLVQGVAKDVTSVVNNLVENAIKHTPAGSNIYIEWYKDEQGRGCLKVTDDGPGIPQQHLLHLTERFYRVDKGRAREQGGTGLGLAIVKHVMLNHNGSLDIQSQPGMTVFTALFPAARIVQACSQECSSPVQHL